MMDGSSGSQKRDGEATRRFTKAEDVTPTKVKKQPAPFPVSHITCWITAAH